ncbi:DUF1501 domain-containing protein [Planctomicrobium sp. SH527]|uniref:DUF1501 domain-containing protein n=1 Tax=Planctomicrobium sp. SH527 TaxID=3448123 RepID=UPI003F5BEC39
MSSNFSQLNFSRRDLLKVGSFGLGSLMLTGLMPRMGHADMMAPRQPNFIPKAKRVIFLFINGGPSQFESFSYKPELKKRDGKDGPKKGKLLGPQLNFAQYGESGMWVSEAFPHIATQVDRICMLHGMQTGSNGHETAIPLLHTGDFQFVRPSLGSWIAYGLGTENQDLPGNFTIKPTRTFGGPSNFGSAFLPSTFQATRLGWEHQDIKKASIYNLQPTLGLTSEIDRETLRLTQSLNEQLRGQSDEVQGVMDSLALGERMQRAVPDVLDLSRETKETLEMYGVDQKPTDDFARQCLLARRLVESGVRFVEVMSSGWDHHSNLDKFKDKATTIDKPVAALLSDLDQRGLLDDTLVIWTGEFGRLPETQILSGKESLGRDHNSKGFTGFMAGGGVRSGLIYGQTDELGHQAIEGAIPLHDFHATILHLLGLDHTKLTYRYGGRDFRLTNVSGNVVKDIIV